MRSDCIYKDVCELCECDNCIRYIEMNYLLQESRLPQNLQRVIDLYPDEIDYDSFVQLRLIKDSIKDRVDSKQFNLLVYSKNTGNGKTSWAVKILLKYFDSVWAGNGLQPRGLFINVPNLLLRLKDFQSTDSDLQQIKKLLLDVDLVVWDDISSTKASDYDNTQLLNYIDNRILAGKANIFT